MKVGMGFSVLNRILNLVLQEYYNDINLQSYKS